MAMVRPIYKGGVPFIKPGMVFKGESGITTNAGAPTNGTSGTGANRFGIGSLLLDTTNGVFYINIGTLASPTWQAQTGGAVQAKVSTLSVNGAIPPHTPATYVITKAGVLADTLAAPTATTDDGVLIDITSNTANAHTITATGLFQTGSAAVNVATFNAFAGASLSLMAYQGLWNVLSANGVSFT